MKSYHDFWEELKNAYPLSHGELKLPIASQVFNFPELNLEQQFQVISSMIEKLIEKIDTQEIKIASVKKNREDGILPLLGGKFTGVLRVDCVLNQENELKILEINADYPDGLILHDFTYSALKGEKKNIHRNQFLKLFSPEKSIYVMYKDGSFFKDAYYQEFLKLKEAGFEVYFGSDEELEFRNGKCYFDGKAIDVIKRVMEVGKFNSEFLKKIAETNVEWINTFDLRILGYKDLLSLVDSPLLPKTLVLNKENITDFFSAKDKWILKPSNLFEGKGILIGNQLSQLEREESLKEKADQTYIVQEFVDMRTVDVSLYDEEKIKEKKLFFDLCPHFFVKEGKVIGRGLVLMRFSEKRILNVAQGGGIGYLNLEYSGE